MMMQLPLTEAIVVAPIVLHIHFSKLHLYGVIMQTCNTVRSIMSPSTYRLHSGFYGLESPFKLLLRWRCQHFLHEHRNSSKQNTWWQHQFKQLMLLAVLPYRRRKRSQVWPLDDGALCVVCSSCICVGFFCLLLSSPKKTCTQGKIGNWNLTIFVFLSVWPFRWTGDLSSCRHSKSSLQKTPMTVNAREAGIEKEWIDLFTKQV